MRYLPTRSRQFVDPWAHPPPTAPGQDNNKAGDILNFLPVAAAAAAAAVAANGNKYTSNTVECEPHNGGNVFSLLNGHENGAMENERNGNGHVNGHDLNCTSELLNVAAKLLNGTAAGGGVPPMNGGNAKDPSVSTTQVTIPKDVSVCLLRDWSILISFIILFAI